MLHVALTAYLTFILLLLQTQLALCQYGPPYRPHPRLTCTNANPVPLAQDCVSLTVALRAIAARPGENYQKTYGRSQVEGDRTAHLPKRFYVEQVSPWVSRSTCQLILDDHPRRGFPNYDQFNLLSVALVGEFITARCLVQNRKIGFDYPGKFYTVQADLLRKDPTALDTLGENSEVVVQKWNVTVGNETMVLKEVNSAYPVSPVALDIENSETTS